MIFYIFMKLIFLPKKKVVSFVHGCAWATTNSEDDKQTSFKMQAEEDCREFIRFLFKSPRHCVRNNRTFSEILMEFCRGDTSGACTRSHWWAKFYINLPRCPVAPADSLADCVAATEWLNYELFFPILVWPSRFLFRDFSRSTKGDLIESLFIRHRFVIY